MKSTMLTLALLFILITSSLQDDGSDCFVSSSTEITQTTCFNKGAKFVDKSYKCCWMKITKNNQILYQCERLSDNLNALMDYKTRLEMKNVRVELLCDSIHDDDLICSTLLGPQSFIEESVCKEKTKQLKNKEYSCCYIKAKVDASDENRSACCYTKNTKEEIQKIIDSCKTEGQTAEVFCSLGGFMPSGMGIKQL